MIKIEFHFFVLFLKPKRTKIFAFNDFRVFFNSAHFLMTQIAQFLQCIVLNIRNSDLFEFLLYLVRFPRYKQYYLFIFNSV
jgi:hypothetical protein